MSTMVERLIAGDTLDFTTSVAAYPPADGWTLVYRLTPRFTAPVQAPITLNATVVGTEYRIQAAPATTATWAAGQYGWTSWVEKAGARQSLEVDGQLQVLANSATLAQGTDTRTQQQIALDAIDAVLANRATVDQKSYSIAGRALERMTVDELLKLRTYYAAQVGAAQGKRGRIYARYV